MKLAKFFITVAAAAFVFASCKSTKKMAAEPAKINTSTTEILAYQGSEWGDQCPKWVRTLNQGSVKNVAKELEVDTKTDMIFVAQGSNKDKELAEVWVKNIEAKQEIAAAISQVIASDAEAAMEAEEGNELDEATKKKLYRSATSMASAIELNGLQKIASFWVRTGTLKKGVKKRTNLSDYEEIKYTYYVVYQMAIDDFKKQAEAAMKTVPDNTSEQAYLKRVLAEKIGQSIYPGNTVAH